MIFLKKRPAPPVVPRAGPGRTGPAPAGTGPAQVLFIIKYIMFIIKNLVNEKSINLNLENFAKNPNPPPKTII